MFDHTSLKPNIWVVNEVFGAADEEFAVSGARRLASTIFLQNAASWLLTGH